MPSSFRPSSIIIGTAGVPQGSVLGPTLWNIIYDGVLRIPLPPGVQITAYADDLALTVNADTLEDLNHRTAMAIGEVEEWLAEHELALAPQKTEALVMRGPRKRDGIKVEVGAHTIPLSKAVGYLGVTIDGLGTFGHHVNRVAKKADARVAALSRILPNIGGPSSGRRSVLLGVVHSTLLYGAPIWHRAMNIAKYKRTFTAKGGRRRRKRHGGRGHHT